MPQRSVASNYTFEQQRTEINLLAADFWSHYNAVETAKSTYLKHDGSNNFTGGTLNVPAAFTINSNSGAGTLTISGNLNVTGTTTTVNTTNLDVTDKNITIAKGNTSDATADGAGITIDSGTDITWNFVDAKDAWVSSIGVEATTFLKGPYGQFTGSGTPTTGYGVEVNAPDENTGQIISYHRNNSAYKQLNLKGSSVQLYTGTTNAVVGTFNSTGLTMESGKNIAAQTLTSTGDVSLGHASATARLDVRRGDADGLIAEFHQNTGYGIDIGSSTSLAYISSGYNQDWAFKTDAGSGQLERLRILNNGKIFVGAYSAGDDFSDAGSFLNIKNDTYGGRIAFSNNTATAGVALMEQFAYWGNNKVAGIIATAGDDNTDKDDGYLSFYTRSSGSGAAEALRITSGGNVDINGTPPWSVAGGDYRNLSISGQVANSGGFLWLGNGTATTNGDFDLGRINFCNGATITSQIAGTTQTSANDDGRISFHTKATGGSLTEKLRITSAGKVGIGTNDPNRTLSVKSNGGQFSIIDDDDSKGQFYCNSGTVSIWATGGSSIAGDLDFATTPSGGSTATRLQITSDGNIKIPGGAYLDFYGSRTTYRHTGSYGEFKNATGDLYAMTQNDWKFGNGDFSLEYLTIKKDTGYVGIGIATPDKTGIQNNVKLLQIDGGDGAELILGNSTSQNVSTNHIGAIAFKNIDNSTGSAPHYAGIRSNCTDTSGNMNLKFYAGATRFEADTPDMLIDSVGRTAINETSPIFGQSNGASDFQAGNPKLGVLGSIGIANYSSTTTDYSQLAFYRRTKDEPQGDGSHRITSTSNMGRIAWYGASNDTSFPNYAYLMQCVASGGDWWGGAARTGTLQIHNHNYEVFRWSANGVPTGRSLRNVATGTGMNAWGNNGVWFNVLDLSGYPSNALYICDAAMQNSSAYTATFWVYKTANATYRVVHDQDSLLHWQMAGSWLQLQQNSGIDQTDTFGHQKIFMSFGMDRALG